MLPDNYASVPNNYFAAPSTTVSGNSHFTLLTTSNKRCLIWCLSINSILNCSNEHFQYCGYYSKYRALRVKNTVLLYYAEVKLVWAWTASLNHDTEIRCFKFSAHQWQRQTKWSLACYSALWQWKQLWPMAFESQGWARMCKREKKTMRDWKQNKTKKNLKLK